MSLNVIFCRASLWVLLVLLVGRLLLCAQTPIVTETNLVVRVMAANLTSGSYQSYEAPGIRIFQGLRPDIVAIQEFRYEASASDGQLRSLVDQAFGPGFFFYREPYTGAGDIPNGIVSRWPILSSGSWSDPVISNRGFAWALIDVPGTNDLYVVSVHLSTSSAGNRNTEAQAIKSYVTGAFPSGAWIVLAGDLNTDTRTEAALDTLETFLSDSPIPADEAGNPNTSASRSKPYDYVLPSFTFATNFTPLMIGEAVYPNGLVFDSRVYTDLASVTPVQAGDSGAASMQHMGVLKSFRISYNVTNIASAGPSITQQPADLAVPPGTDATFTVSAVGAAPLHYQWWFERAPLAGATSTAFTRTNAQFADAGAYQVVVTNNSGAVTSAPARLVVGIAPVITTQPLSQSVEPGGNVLFSVAASGTQPLSYQWRMNGANLAGATQSSFGLTNVQASAAGGYTVVITNPAGSVTSQVAVLIVGQTSTSELAQWNFNNTNFSVTSPAPSLGAGVLTLVGGTTAAWVSGSGSADPASPNTAWNTANYPPQGTGNKSAGARWRVDTTGRQNIVIRWDQRLSNTASKYARLQYSTNGVDFFDYPTPIIMSAASVFEPKTNSLAHLPEVNDNPEFAFRIVSEFESTAIGGAPSYIGANGAYGTGGTIRFDMVTVFGEPIVVQPPVLSATTLSGSLLQFTVTGTAGASYIVESSSDLRPNTWTPVVTNKAPFTFQTPVAFPSQNYYRARK